MQGISIPFIITTVTSLKTIYLKVPKGMTEEWDEDFKDHYPTKDLSNLHLVKVKVFVMMV